jgi:hypothetical protein
MFKSPDVGVAILACLATTLTVLLFLLLGA